MEKETDIIDENITEEVIKEEAPKKEKKKKDKEIIEDLNQEIGELKDRLLRNAADLENFKKRMQQEKINDRKYAASNLINDLLVPLDQFAKVVEMKTENDVLKNFLIGFKMINDQFKSILETEGVKEIDALNKPFDPTLHYAVEKVDIKEKDNGINVEVLQTGYMYKERILRPAMVKVNEWSENENGEDK